MALLSLDKIREIQNVAELYAQHERARLVRVDREAVERRSGSYLRLAGEARRD